MPMMGLWVRLSDGIDQEAWRSRLAAEIGARRASEPNVELSRRGELLEVLTMDFVAAAYAVKVSAALGGQRCSPSGEPGQPLRPAPWTSTPWIATPWWRRLRLWLGPTRSSE